MIEVKVGQVTVVVREATIRDDLHAQMIRAKLDIVYANDNNIGYWRLFSDLISCVDRADGLPFDTAQVHDLPDDEVGAAYEAFLALSKKLKDKWIKAWNALNVDTDPITGPEPLPKGSDPNG